MGRFCLFSSIFQLPFYTLVFSEWGCFFLLVRLGRGIQRTFFPCQRKRRRSYRAFWLVATVAIGGCGTRSAQTVLALFPPSPLRLRRPIKAESGIVAFACILTPSVLLTPPSFGHLPYILLCKTPRNATGHGRGGDVFSFRFCSDFIRDTL